MNFSNPSRRQLIVKNFKGSVILEASELPMLTGFFPKQTIVKDSSWKTLSIGTGQILYFIEQVP